MQHQPNDPDFDRRVRSSFAKQAAMSTLGVTLERVTPGEVHLTVQYQAELTQQHGFLHAGIVTAAMDSACGYAALSLMEPGTAVLSVEFKVQLLAPARGAWFRAVGRVIRAGRTLTVVAGELRAYPHDDVSGEGDLVAILSGTMMSVRDRPALRD
ncbi:MAG TPA: PaaI family thioesterase [Gemmatimonadaceae bacterium]|nr:PaaI family thioesterase [Gemmatimonadaceae bacterium]